jgi:type II secretory pathway pseudopilin PulG
MSRLRSQGGFTLIEVMIGALLLGMGLIVVAGSFDHFRNLGNLSAKKNAATHVAQKEIERLRALGFDGLEMDASPGTSTNPNDPRYGVTSGSPPKYKPSQTSPAEDLILAADPATADVKSAPSSWDAESAHGQVYRFVTWHDDLACGAACPGTQDGKRITVAVTVDAPNAPRKPIVVSTVVSNPAVTVQPPDDPVGGTGTGPPGPGGTGAGGTGVFTTLYLYDTPGMYDSRQPITGDHNVHDTKKKPDLLGEAPPPALDDPAQSPPVFNYAEDVDGGAEPGAVIFKSSDNCNGTDKKKQHQWATQDYTTPVVLTGNAAATLYTSTVDGTSGAASICIQVYDIVLRNTAGSKGDGSVIGTPYLLGSATYSATQWPTTPDQVTFQFRYLAPNTTYTLPAGHSLGIQLGVHNTSADNLAFYYDHPDYASFVQVERPTP